MQFHQNLWSILSKVWNIDMKYPSISIFWPDSNACDNQNDTWYCQYDEMRRLINKRYYNFNTKIFCPIRMLRFQTMVLSLSLYSKSYLLLILLISKQPIKLNSNSYYNSPIETHKSNSLLLLAKRSLNTYYYAWYKPTQSIKTCYTRDKLSLCPGAFSFPIFLLLFKWILMTCFEITLEVSKNFII